LTVTDANLVLGRLSADYFPKIFGPNENESLDYDASRKAFEKMTAIINNDLKSSGGKLLSVEKVCLGFLDVANESMCDLYDRLQNLKDTIHLIIIFLASVVLGGNMHV
jgi:5-oxoprolinase (ATP-hydrolysing)